MAGHVLLYGGGPVGYRAKRVPQDRHASFPLHVQWGLQGDLSELELVADYLTSFLVSMKAPLKLAKRIIVALSNGGSIESWAKGNNTHVDKSAMPMHSAGADILARWIKECKQLHLLSAQSRPDLVHHFQELGEKCPEYCMGVVAST